MKNLSGVFILSLIAWLTAGCASDGTGADTASQPKQNVEHAIAEAESAFQKVYSVEYAWRDTEDLLKSAKEAAAKGETDKALELARQAKLESDMAYNQYLAAQKAGPRYP